MRDICAIPLSLRLRDILASFRQERKPFWFLFFYFFIEYIRPQSMYKWIDILPWGVFSLLLVVISISYFREKIYKLNSIDIFAILFVLWVAVSMPFAWSPEVSIRYWTTLASWVLMYYSFIVIIKTRSRYILFYILFLILNLKISEFGARTFALRGFSFASWGLSGPPGWFKNSGELAMQMVVVFSMSSSLLLAIRDKGISSSRWLFLFVLFPGTAFLTILGSSSRGGQLALALVVVFLFLRGGYFFRKIFALLFLGYLAYVFLPSEQVKRFETMGEDPTSKLRIMHWQNALEVLSQNPLGIGYKNWIDYYRYNFVVEKYEEIHNTVLQLLVEQGYIGGMLFLILLLITLLSNRRVIKKLETDSSICSIALAAMARGVNLSIFGAIVASMFMSVLYYPVFWVAFAFSSAVRRVAFAK